MTASWTRRLPWTAISLTRIGRVRGSGGGLRERRRRSRRSRAKKMERAHLPRRGHQATRASSGPAFSVPPARAAAPTTWISRKTKFCPLDIHLDARAVRELPAHDGLGQRILDVLLDRPAELPGAVGRVVPLLDQEVEGGLGGLELDALLAELGVDPVDHQPDDLRDVLLGQGVEDDDVVDAVDELRPERPLQLLEHPLLHLLVGAARRPRAGSRATAACR